MLSFFHESDLTLAYIVSSDMAGSTDDRVLDALADLIYESCYSFWIIFASLQVNISIESKVCIDRWYWLCKSDIFDGTISDDASVTLINVLCDPNSELPPAIKALMSHFLWCGIQLECEAEKAAQKLIKHGVSFEDAELVAVSSRNGKFCTSSRFQLNLLRQWPLYVKRSFTRKLNSLCVKTE